jgi:hypothetical protein
VYLVQGEDGALAAELVGTYFKLFERAVQAGDLKSRLLSALLTGARARACVCVCLRVGVCVCCVCVRAHVCMCVALRLLRQAHAGSHPHCGGLGKMQCGNITWRTHFTRAYASRLPLHV